MPHHRQHDAKPDINQVSKEELMQVPGIEEEMAESIIQHRPYNNQYLRQIVKRGKNKVWVELQLIDFIRL